MTSDTRWTLILIFAIPALLLVIFALHALYCRIAELYSLYRWWIGKDNEH